MAGLLLAAAPRAEADLQGCGFTGPRGGRVNLMLVKPLILAGTGVISAYGTCFCSSPASTRSESPMSVTAMAG
ncbi:MAG TPA: hypothetical protein VMQ86_04805 [Bryobacteraceae bacterium]|jgi:hypothetical protein|nr:hypothetical protein [Bryobacteraceae bacterium]